MLSDILSAINPYLFSKALRIRSFSRNIAEVLEYDRIWDVEIAALLSQIGIIAIPQEILDKSNKGAELTEKEKIMIDSIPGVSETLLKHIPRLETIARAIYFQNKKYDGSDLPFNDQGR